jgi:type II secretion system protein N
VKERLLRVVKLLAFPAFYLFCLVVFGYLTFPYGRLKDRVIAEFEKHGKPGQRLEIGKLGSYWLSGVELSGVKLHLPPDEPRPALPGADFGAPAAVAKETVLVIDEAHARVRLWPLLLGRVRLDFWMSAFGGEIKGSAPMGSAKGEVEIEIDHVDVARIEPLAEAIGVPLRGTATGKLVLDAPDGKFNKANGSFDLTLADCVVSDGKTKIQGLIELPPAKLGEVVIAAEAKDGALKVTKLSAGGTDLEIVGDGKIALREPWGEAVADLVLRFKFTDAYRGKNGTTKSLLGEPGSSVPGLIEMQVPKMKRAKRPDGFYGWHIWGPLHRLKFDPSTADFAGGGLAAPAVTAPPSKRPFPRAGGGDGPPLSGLKRPMPGPLPPKGDAPLPAEAHREDHPPPQAPPVLTGEPARRSPALPVLAAPAPPPPPPPPPPEAVPEATAAPAPDAPPPEPSP